MDLVTTGAFGTFGSTSSFPATTIRVMYEDTVVQTVAYQPNSSNYNIAAGHTYVININQSGTMAVSISEDGWNWVIQNSSW